VQQIDVQPPIVVIIDQGHARAQAHRVWCFFSEVPER
jgi:hypothetical protein